ncbi:24096_t:CDS:2 [Racocetra persica]|uniref:24096_t:CDS:1 n=1 Tax=Racocetra persica TaxID=160502 RepID=A0ACA9R8R0_9GLOM|nr:24096_t:CDS:2 [Racocetra persica]
MTKYSKIYCEHCIRLKLINETWASGNKKLDIFLRKCQDESPVPHCIVEWIEFCELENVKFLAEGGLGKVYSQCGHVVRSMGWNETSNTFVRKRRNVALKVFNGDGLPDEEFFQEAYWNHIFTKQRNYRPCVVGVLGFTNNQEGKYMIVLDLCEGGDLQNYLQKHYKIMGWKDRVKVAWDISYDIHRIVENGSIHGDLHPGNILLLNECMIDDWYISDLGTCGPVDMTKDQKREIKRVLPYMAPELLCGDCKTQESDIYSFGIIMWTISAGCIPFNDRYGDPCLVNDIICGLRPSIIPGTPKEYTELMRKCWDKDPHNRISARDAVQTLKVLLRDIIENNFIDEYPCEINNSWDPLKSDFTVFRTSELLSISHLTSH